MTGWIVAPESGLLNMLEGLRAATTQANFVLNDESYAGMVALFQACAGEPGAMSALRRAADYDKCEFLGSVSRDGALVLPTERMIQSYRRIAAAQPGFRLWLEEASAKDGRPVLLVARWLCHLAGFRHHTVHLLMAHPTRADYVLLQLRGLDKPNYPACFDVPAAGHVIGLDSPRETVSKELAEELGLDEADVLDLRQLGSRDVVQAAPHSAYWDVERVAVFAGRLAAGKLDKIAFADGEAAGLCLLALAELRPFAARYPERVASGLFASLSFLERMA